MLRAGKALSERSVVVRMQLHAHPVPLFGATATHHEMRNEFVMRLQPGEGIGAGAAGVAVFWGGGYRGFRDAESGCVGNAQQ